MKECATCKVVFDPSPALRGAPKTYCSPKCRNGRRRSWTRVKERIKNDPAYHASYLAYFREYKDRHRSLAQLVTLKSWLKRKYGLTIEDFQKLRDQQNDLCAICGKPETQKGRRLLSVDHCHETGKVRALLCKHCNSAIGHLHDDPSLARKAYEYLARHSNA